MRMLVYFLILVTHLGCNKANLLFRASLLDQPSITDLTVPPAGIYQTASVFTLTTSEAVVVTGTPRVPLTIGTTIRYATYDSVTSTSTELHFIFTPLPTDVDFDGIQVGSTLDLNGGSVSSVLGAPATLTLPTADTTGMKVGSKIMDLEFPTQQFFHGDVSHTLATFPGWTFARASPGFALNQANTWLPFVANQPRVTDRGLLVEGARTNFCANFSANPTDLTNVTLGGDPAAILSVVNDGASLASAGLAQIATSGNVYRIDNSVGSIQAFVDLAGEPGSTALFNASVYVRGGTGSLQTSSGTTLAAIPASASYTRVAANFNPSPATINLRITAAAGQTLYFILNQLEQGASPTSPIIVAGASAVRSADSATIAGLAFELPNFTSLVEVDLDNLDGVTRFLYDFNDGTTSNRILSQRSSTNRLSVQVFANGVGGFQPNQLNFSGARTIKQALRYDGSAYRWAYDNTLGLSGTYPLPLGPLTTLTLGQTRTNSQQAFGYVKKFVLFQTSKDDTELQALTQ